jgi:hypothetical protein
MGMGYEGDRAFTYMDKEVLFSYLDGFVVLDQWTHTPQEGTNLKACHWLNAVVRKVSFNSSRSAI